jgi:hypothetical protein
MKRIVTAVVLSIQCVMIAACSPPFPEQIIYDADASSAYAVAKLNCAQEVQLACEKEARKEEESFRSSLSEAFLAADECKRIPLIIESGVASLPTGPAIGSHN